MTRQTTFKLKPPKRALALILAGVLCGTSLTPMAAVAKTGSVATWNPAASEQLIKLPPHYLKKSIDNDFSKSGLAAVLIEKEDQAGLKRQTLTDLQAASERAQGELRTELQHQFLAEKQAYIQIMNEHQDLRRRQAKTKIRLYEKLLRKMERNRGAMTPQRAQLVEKQNEARSRFETSRAAVDTKLFRSTMATESRYAQEYAKNLSAIENLVAAIRSHPMSATTEIDGQAVSKPEYLRRLVAEAEADLAVIDQEHTILGYMAKLVSLDALALSENFTETADVQDALMAAKPERGLTADVDFFVSR